MRFRFPLIHITRRLHPPPNTLYVHIVLCVGLPTVIHDDLVYVFVIINACINTFESRFIDKLWMLAMVEFSCFMIFINPTKGLAPYSYYYFW